MFDLLKLLVQAGCLFGVVCVVALSLPESRFREFLRPIVMAGIAVLCGVYVISPVDVLPELVAGPFGLIDDVGVAIGGFAAARSALHGVSSIRH